MLGHAGLRLARDKHAQDCARVDHAGQPFGSVNDGRRTDGQVERLLLPVREDVPGVDAVNDPIGQRVGPQNFAGLDEVP